MVCSFKYFFMSLAHFLIGLFWMNAILVCFEDRKIHFLHRFLEETDESDDDAEDESD